MVILCFYFFVHYIHNHNYSNKQDTYLQLANCNTLITNGINPQ